MTLALRRACALAAVVALAAGCVAGASARPVRPEPPAPLPEIKSGPPTPGLVWVAGAWHWDGAAYVWIPGHWESPPPAALGR